MTAEERRAEYPVRIAAKSRALLPTSTEHGNYNRKGLSPNSGDGLATVAKLLDAEDAAKWPTPMAEGDLHYRFGGNSQASKSLAVAVLFPTPCCDRLGAGDGAKKMLKKNQILSSEEHRELDRGYTGSLNPDWEEWLMFTPIGWTDLDTPNHRLLWLHPTFDPAATTCAASANLPYIPRLTTRRKYRVARVKGIGNMQYPPTAFIMAAWGFAFLQLQQKENTQCAYT